jgi:hypothetical protein
MPAGIAPAQQPAPAIANVGQIIVGTYRLWYTENFGSNWVTLPTGTDPLPANLVQDSLGQAITVCRWQTPDVAWVLTPKLLTRYARTPGSDNGGGPGSWAMQTVVAATVNNKNDGSFAFGPMRDAVAWTEVAVNLDAPGTPRGTLGALYLGTSGKASDSAVDTLWWFDGTGVWMPTGLRNHAQGVGAPVTAVVCDAAFPDEVTPARRSACGGTTASPAELPSGTGERPARGRGGTCHPQRRRAAPAARGHRARGVWELRLTAPGGRTHVRPGAPGRPALPRPTVPPTAPLHRRQHRALARQPDVRPRVAPVPRRSHRTGLVRGGANARKPAASRPRCAAEERRVRRHRPVGQLLQRGAARARCAIAAFAAGRGQHGQHRHGVLERRDGAAARPRRALGKRHAQRGRPA